MNAIVHPYFRVPAPAVEAEASRERVESVRQIARDVAGPAAAAVDREARFPREATDALREKHLLSAHVPERLGGFGVSIAELGLMCEALGQRCASAAMVFAMHQVQVACLVRHGSSPFLQGHLGELVRGQRLIASVNSEAGVGGNVRTSIAVPRRADVGKRPGHDLLGAESGGDDLAGAAGATHAHRIPGAQQLHVGLGLAHQHHGLVSGHGLDVASHRQQQVLGGLAVGHHGPLLAQPAGAVGVAFDRADDSPYSVARHLRDANSAALMIGNERIRAANGSLHMVYRDDAL
jgi:hypothetical protein